MITGRGFVVVGFSGELLKSGIREEEVLSRRFAFKDAALRYAELMRTTGRECWVRELTGWKAESPQILF
ncbi:MAG TPA: hypothetical protein VF814_08675 [Casimicrobiaceae bacterium]